MHQILSPSYVPIGFLWIHSDSQQWNIWYFVAMSLVQFKSTGSVLIEGL